MEKKMKQELWGLWNYNVLQDTSYRRKDCREAANRLCSGGQRMAADMFKRKAFRITKIAVREI
jgi:hypothetical protein